MFSTGFDINRFSLISIRAGALALCTLALCAGVVQAQPFAYVANNDADTLSIIDLATRVVTRTITVGNGPEAVAVTPDGRFVYVTNGLSPRGITVVDAEAGTVVNTISGLVDPVGLAFSPDGRLAYVVNRSGTGNGVAVVDTATRVVLRNIAAGILPSKIVISADGRYLYVVNDRSGPGAVTVIRTADNMVVNTITVGRVAPLPDAVLSRDGNRLYVVNQGDDTVSVIDTSNGVGNGVMRTFNAPDSPYWIAISPNGAHIYVVRATGTQGAVAVIDSATGATVGALINVGAGPESVAIRPDGALLYTNTSSGNPDSVVEINVSTRETRNIGVGADPRGIAISPLTAALATTSAASFSTAPLAGEAIGAIFGTNLAGNVTAATTAPLPTSLGGTVVKVRDSANVERLAPLFFVSPTQVNYLVPPGTAVGNATVTLSHTHGFVSVGGKAIAPVAPGLFAANANGQGIATAVVFRLRADGTQAFEPVARFDAAQNRFVPLPIELGPESDQTFLLLFGTGMRFRSSLTTAAATIGGVASDVLFVGAQGDLVGLDQVNLKLPRSLAGRGEVSVNLQVDGQAANPVLVSVR